MANGFAPYLLKSINELAGEDNPSYKITPMGYIKMLLASNAVRGARVLELNTGTGQKRTVYVKYAPRTSDSYVQEEDNCDIDFTPAYLESQLTAPRVAKLGIYISFEDLRKYQEDAIKTVAIGQPSTTFMRELYETVIRSANALVGTMDRRLQLDTVWGINATTGNNNAVSVNINQNATVNSLTEGLTKLLSDAQANEMWGDLKIVGSGNFNSFQIQKMSGALAATLAGLNQSAISGYEWFFDLKAATNWGANQIGIFSQGAIGLVDLNKYIGSFSGQLGTSTLFQATLPVATNQNDGSVQGLSFDMQLKPIECPTELMNGYSGQVETYDKGYQLLITKNYGLWQIPADAYAADDRLTGNNGALRYTITNTCEACD